jgi:hypothetical protein
MLRAVAGAERDIGVDRAWPQHRDADIGALQFALTSWQGPQRKEGQRGLNGSNGGCGGPLLRG